MTNNRDKAIVGTPKVILITLIVYIIVRTKK